MDTTKSYKVVPTHYSIPNKIVKIIDNNPEVGEMVKIEYYLALLLQNLIRNNKLYIMKKVSNKEQSNNANLLLADSKIFLSDKEKDRIVIGSETNRGKVEGLTTFRNWLINGEVVGRWRDVYEDGGKFYFC